MDFVKLSITWSERQLMDEINFWDEEKSTHRKRKKLSSVRSLRGLRGLISKISWRFFGFQNFDPVNEASNRRKIL